MIYHVLMHPIAGSVELSQHAAIVYIVLVVLSGHGTGIDVGYYGIVVAVKSGSVVHESQDHCLAGSLGFDGGGL